MPRETSRPWKIALAAVIAVWAAIMAGWIRQDRQLSAQEAQLQSIIAQLVAQNPDFAHLHPTRSSHPKVWIFGQLNSQAEIDQLRNAVAARFGEAEANRIVRVMLPLTPSSQPGGA